MLYVGTQAAKLPDLRLSTGATGSITLIHPSRDMIQQTSPTTGTSSTSTNVDIVLPHGPAMLGILLSPSESPTINGADALHPLQQITPYFQGAVAIPCIIHHVVTAVESRAPTPSQP